MDGLVQNFACLDSSNCNQVNAFFHSLRKISPSCFCYSSYSVRVAFHSVVNCTCSLLFFSIFHYLFTTFAWRPFFPAKTIQGFLHLICIINRLHKRATSKKNKMGKLWLCPDLLIQQAWLPCLLGNASFSCCSIMQ